MLNFKIKTPQQSHHQRHSIEYSQHPIPQLKPKHNRRQPFHVQKQTPQTQQIYPHHNSPNQQQPCTFSHLLKNSHHPQTSTQTLQNCEFSQLINQRLQAMQSCSSRYSSKSKENSRSPLRVKNTHRLNNTPKIKETNTKSGKDLNKEKKTFADVLRTTTFKLEQEPIDLLCSEKIDKFIKEDKAADKSDKIRTKDKSNLQSTGIITLSQPQQNNQSHKNLDEGTHALSLQSIREFQHLSQQRLSLQQITAAALQFKEHLSMLLQNYNQKSFSDTIIAQYNPQTSNQEIRSQINELNFIKTSFQNHFESIIKKLQQTAKGIENELIQKIANLKAIEECSINWTSVEQYLKQQQELENRFYQNEVMITRLEYLESIVGKDYSFNHNFQSTQDNEQTEQLRKINTFLKKQFAVIASLEQSFAGRQQEEWAKKLQRLKKRLLSLERLQRNLYQSFLV